MSDKLFVLKIREYNGEQEYDENIFTIAPDEKTAKKWAREYVKEWYFESDVYDKNGADDSLWWKYISDDGEITWKVISLTEEYELMGVQHTDGCKNNNSHVKLVIE